MFFIYFTRTQTLYCCKLSAACASISVLHRDIAYVKHFKTLWQQGSSLRFGKIPFCSSICVYMYSKDLKYVLFKRIADDATETALQHQMDQIWSLSDASCLSVSHQGHPEWAQFSFISIVFLSHCCLTHFPHDTPHCSVMSPSVGERKSRFCLEHNLY